MIYRLITSFVLLGLLSALIISCQGTKEKKQPVKNQQKFESIPDDLRVRLFNTVDYIDYTWYELPYAISQSDPNAIKGNISYIGYEKFPHGEISCPKAMGRKYYHANGEIIAEAEIVLSPTCNYYLFMNGNTPLYASKITDAGVAFYQNLFNNMKGATQN